MKKSIVFLCILFSLAIRANAQQTTPDVPRTISYQAALTDKDGNPIKDDTYQITARLYADALGQQPIWWGTYRVQAERGVINLQLGSGAFPLPNADKMSTPLWLGIQLNSNGELDYYAPLSAAPYALTVPNGAITANKLASGAVTTDKVNMDYVSSITVNGQQMTGKGTPLNIATGSGLDATVDPGTNTLLLTTGGTTSRNGKGGTAQSHQGTSSEAWGEKGNSNISIPTNFVGTNDTSRAIEIHLEDSLLATAPISRIMHAELPFSGSAISPNIIWGFGSGAATGNSISMLKFGSTIAGGGKSGSINSINAQFSFIGSGLTNSISGDTSSIVGGIHNTIEDGATSEFIGGGSDNLIGNNVDDPMGSAIVGGFANKVYNISSAIVGGTANVIGVHSDLEPTFFGDVSSAIVGGDTNFIGEGHSFIGGGSRNTIGINGTVPNDVTAWSSILGGDHNTVLGQYDQILGGWFNKIYSGWEWSIIGGGDSNEVNGHYEFLGGGYWNHARGKAIVIAGGGQNRVGMSVGNPNGTDFSVIGGGELDTIDGLTSSHSTIAGGEKNSIIGDTSGGAFIGGGNQNRITGSGNGSAVISGGKRNTIDAGSPGGVISGGMDNYVQGGFSAVVGGDSNSIIADKSESFIGSGHKNLIGGHLTSIVGGLENANGGYWSTIGGGVHNYISSSGAGSFLGGGSDDSTLGGFSVIGGGAGNMITDEGDYSSITGGLSNFIRSFHSSIVGGKFNIITTDGSSPATGTSCFIGAGENNTIDGHGINAPGDPIEASAIVAGRGNKMHEFASFIGAGENNETLDDHQFIGAGLQNMVDEGGSSGIVAGEHNLINTGVSAGRGSAFIGAGDSNSLDGLRSAIVAGKSDTIIFADQAFIGAGEHNTIFNGLDAAIPGGDSLIAQSYAQTVMGYHNIPDAAFHGRGTPHSGNNASLVIVGNGDDATHPSDAFTVSYGGHSTVFDENGTGSVRPYFYGATYQDNPIVAWADIPGMTGLSILTGITPTSDFGVKRVFHTGPGTYVIDLNSKDAKGNSLVFKNASITVTVQENDTTGVNALAPAVPGRTSVTGCGHATASEIGILNAPFDNAFIVHIYSLTTTKAGGNVTNVNDCTPNDQLPFFIKVCARK